MVWCVEGRDKRINKLSIIFASGSGRIMSGYEFRNQVQEGK